MFKTSIGGSLWGLPDKHGTFARRREGDKWKTWTLIQNGTQSWISVVYPVSLWQQRKETESVTSGKVEPEWNIQNQNKEVIRLQGGKILETNTEENTWGGGGR